jgi:hypothetical protein
LAGTAVGGLAGLALAVVGAFAGVPVLAVGIVATAAAASLLAGAGLRPAERSASAAAVVALLLAAVTTGVAVHHRGNHLLTDRDPGVYATTGLWTAATGGLVVDDGLADAGLGELPNGTDDALGYHDRAGPHSARPQFPHLFPTYLALAAEVGSPGLLFAVAPAFAGLGLLALFALGREVARPWTALAATALVAVSMPQLQLSRDVLSELPAQALLLGGLWALAVAWRRQVVPLAAVAGLLLGSGLGVRLDLTLGLLGIVVLDAVARRRAELRRVRTAAVGGAAVGLAVCATDLAVRSPLYVRELGAESAALAAVVVAAVGVTRVVLPWAERRRASWLAALAGRRARIATVAALAVVAFVACLGLVRPHVETVRQGPAAIVAALQAADGVEVDPTRRYWERSLLWVTWYLGVPAVVLGTIGWALVVRDAVARAAPARRLLAVAFSTGAVLALLRPSISPDHLWAMRRYLPLVLPGFALGAAVAVDAIATRVVGRRWRAPLAAGLLVAAAVPAGVTSWSTADARVQDGVLGLFGAACEQAPERALFVVEDASFTEELGAMPLRTLCERPVTSVRDGAGLGEVAAVVAGAGLEAVAVELRYEGSEPRPLGDGAVTILTAVDGNRLDSSIVRAPSRLGSTTWQLFLRPLSPPAT